MSERTISYNQQEAGLSLEEKLDRILQNQEELFSMVESIKLDLEELDTKLSDLNLQDGRDYDILEP